MISKKFDLKNPVCFKEDVEIEDALDETGYGPYNLYLLITCCILNIGATLDLFESNIIVPAASCDLNLTLAETGLLMSVSRAGFLFALPWGYVADTRGRKPTILIAGIIGCTVSVISSFSTSFLMMAVLKFITSIFSATSLIMSLVFLGESTSSKYRTRYLLILNVAHFVSDFIGFVLAFLILRLDFAIPISFIKIYKPWRLLSLSFSIPMAVGTVLICFLQETPKFDAAIGRSEKAIDSLKKIYKINYGKKNIYPVKSLTKINDNNEIKSFWDSVVKQFIPIFRPPLLWRTIQLLLLLTICISICTIFYAWFPAMMNSFFISKTKNINFCQKIIANITPIRYNETCVEHISMGTINSALIYTFLFALFNTAFVAFANCRRVLIIGSCLISGACCIFVNIVHHDFASLVLFFLIQCVGVTFGSVQSYFIDVYPTSCRSVATTLGSTVSNLVSVGGVSLLGAVVVINCELTFYYCAAYVFCGIPLAMLLPRRVTTADTSIQ